MGNFYGKFKFVYDRVIAPNIEEFYIKNRTLYLALLSVGFSFSVLLRYLFQVIGINNFDSFVFVLIKLIIAILIFSSQQVIFSNLNLKFYNYLFKTDTKNNKNILLKILFVNIVLIVIITAIFYIINLAFINNTLYRQVESINFSIIPFLNYTKLYIFQNISLDKFFLVCLDYLRVLFIFDSISILYILLKPKCK